jgi:hypothetical protein
MSETDDIKRKAGWAIRELNSFYEPVTLDVRAENAFGVAVKFFELIRTMVPEEIEQKKLMASWMKAVRDADYKKFRRTLRRYHRTKEGAS